MDRSEENCAIEQVVDRLTMIFPEVPQGDVAWAVEEARPEFDDSPIRSVTSCRCSWSGVRSTASRTNGADGLQP
jgi:hypothetical protein